MHCDCDADAILYGPIPKRGTVTLRCVECDHEWLGIAVDGRVIVHPVGPVKELT